ncbi:MAG: hypothetical protein K6F00_08760 [Lachnospiraceae bacterium]|nr:hypothetical protein [Lachnospiraceae bacterium]
MLKIPSLPSDPVAADIVKKFINNRLIGMMEEIIEDEIAFVMAMSGGIDQDLGEKPLDEVVDMDSLMQNLEFAENVSLSYLPDNYPIEKANREFIGLYRLLRAKDEYVPELPMEYVLDRIIENAIWQVDMINEDMADGFFDALKDNPFFDGTEEEGELTTIERIPNPDRAVVLAALEKECEEIELPEDDEDDYGPEDMILLYEDLRNYVETCFWDTDFAFLDEMDEDTLINSVEAKQLGIDARTDVKKVELSLDGNINVNMEINAAPWDMEE